MVPRLIALLLLCPLLSGCMSSVRVYRSNSLASPPQGIPFYVKTSVCKQESVWIEPQYLLTFQVTGAQPYGPMQKILTRQEYRSDAVEHFIGAPNPNTWHMTILSLPGPVPVNEESPSAVANQENFGNWIEVANTGAVETVVDYEDVFYLNSGRPLTGTTQVDAKLGPDGTLAEASAQVQEQTLSTIASTLGSVAGAVTTAAVAGIAAAVQAPHPGPENHLTIATRSYQHTHTAYSGFPARPDTCVPQPSGVFNGSFAVTEVKAAAEKTANPGNTINVSGSIQLPKPAAAPSPATSTAKQP